MPCACIGFCACAAATALLSGGITYYFYDKIKYIINDHCQCKKNVEVIDCNIDTDDLVKNYSATQ
jgi:hypothetical protein